MIEVSVIETQQTLSDLAERMGAFAPSSANRLRSLAAALDAPIGSDNWQHLDVRRAFDVDGLVERATAAVSATWISSLE